MNVKNKCLIGMVVSSLTLLSGCSALGTSVTTCTFQDFTETKDRVMELHGEKWRVTQMQITDTYDLTSSTYEEFSREEAVQEIYYRFKRDFDSIYIAESPHFNEEWDKETDTFRASFMLDVKNDDDNISKNGLYSFLLNNDKNYKSTSKKFVNFVYAQYKTYNQKRAIEEPTCEGKYVNSAMDSLNSSIEQVDQYLEELANKNKMVSELTITDSFEANTYISKVFKDYFEASSLFYSSYVNDFDFGYIDEDYGFKNDASNKTYRLSEDGEIFLKYAIGNNKEYGIGEALIFDPSTENTINNDEQAVAYVENYVTKEKLSFNSVKVDEFNDGFYKVTIARNHGDLVYLVNQYGDIYNGNDSSEYMTLITKHEIEDN